MNKIIKYILCFLFSFSLLFILSSCNQKQEKEEMEYPKIEELNYSEMEKINAYIIKDNIKYNYVFFFEENICMNAEISIDFETEEKVSEYYESIKDSEEYTDIKINGNSIKYLSNPENFIYMLYSKEMLMEQLRENDFVFE